MVSILKHPTSTEKGLIVFTHKERQLFLQSSNAIRRRIPRLHDSYLVGMHWGSYFRDEVGSVEFINFDLASPNCGAFRNNETLIPLCSRDFIDPKFQEMGIETIWDILLISRPVGFKCNRDFMKALRLAYDEGFRLKALIVCPSIPGEKPANYDDSIFRAYADLFDSDERELIQLIDAPIGRNLFPIPHDLLPLLYNASEAFVLPSQNEGGSKVISESLLCGTPVIARRDLRGGGLDHLDETNSLLFKGMEELSSHLMSISSGDCDVSFNPRPLREHLTEGPSTTRLISTLAHQFPDSGWDSDTELDASGLAFRLPSHTTELPPRFRGDRSDDLRSPWALVRFIDSLLKESTSRLDDVRVAAEYMKNHVEGKLDGLRKRIENVQLR